MLRKLAQQTLTQPIRVTYPRCFFTSIHQFKPVASDRQYDLYRHQSTYCLVKKFSCPTVATNIKAQGKFSQVKEEQIALLSSVQAQQPHYANIFINFITNRVITNRADLIHYEKTKSVALIQHLAPSHYESSVMLMPQKIDVSKMKVRAFQHLVVDKDELLKSDNLIAIKKFLLENSYWAEEDGLTEESLVNRIKESQLTFAIMDPKKGCRGFISYFSNGEFGYIYNMVIHRDERGQGIGTALLHCLYQKLPDDQAISLISATKGDGVAIAPELYKKFGFEHVQGRPELGRMIRAIDVPQEKLECEVSLRPGQ